MSIQYFYNFCLKSRDHTDLGGDLLSGVRRSFYQGYDRIKDKITSDSEAAAFSYEFSLEKEKPMKWLVKDAKGTTVQDVRLSDNGMYYIYFYEKQELYKRLLFSKHHTLLKVEYFDPPYGTVRATLEPRKAQNDLCILYTRKSDSQPIPLFSEPEVYDDEIRQRLLTEFTDYTVIASTDAGIVRFLSEEQLAAFRLLKEKYEKEAAEKQEETFVGGNTPLLDKISAKDFNVKRNLSSSLDITRALDFGMSEEPEEAPAGEESPGEIAVATEPAVPAVTEELVPAEPETVEEASAAQEDEPITETPEPETPVEAPDKTEPETEQTTQEPANNNSDEPEETAEEPVAVPKPDKMIMADGAMYSYFGELDAQGNRSGYGRTLTEEGHTAYEGYYLNDKRSGSGSYFYKNGELCYAGEWLENARHGVGVGVSSRDGSIHVGNWKNNKPDGNGVRLTAGGDIKFVCKELSDGCTVLMHYMPDDTVILSKYNEKGMKTGDKIISLKDLP